jgi:3-dehydroquinate synthase
MLEASGPDFDRETVIAKCVEWKANVVKQDERDTGERMKLNLGHTIGHGVEACSNFTLSHGKSVAIGLAIVCRASKCVDSHRIIACLEKFGLPITANYPAEEILPFTLSDKKRSGGTVNLIIPREIGHCDIAPTPVDDILPFIQAGL